MEQDERYYMEQYPDGQRTQYAYMYEKAQHLHGLVVRICTTVVQRNRHTYEQRQGREENKHLFPFTSLKR